MSRSNRAGLATLLLSAAAATSPAPAAAADPPRLSFLYGPDSSVQPLIRPADGQTPLSIEDGARRQEPSGGHLFMGAADRRARVAKVSAREIRDLSAPRIARRLRAAIDDGCGRFDCASGLVAIDELGARFSDGRVRIRYKTVVVRGRRHRVVAWNDVVATRRGWRLVRGTPPLPAIRPASPGARLSDAMRILGGMRFGDGGTYADRVHFYIAPAFVTSVGLGRGPHRTLGRDGLPHRTGWRGVMPALARAGGVWLEMYHGIGGVTPFTEREWRAAPKGFVRYLRRFGGSQERVHFMLARAPNPPLGTRGCGSPMVCQWRLADLPGINRAVLRNGPGAYAVGEQAPEWLAQYNARVRPFPAR